MKNNAVTEEAPAVSDRDHGNMTIEETMAETGFLPTDEHYRLTGEIKETKEEKETPAVTSEEKETKEGDEQPTPGADGDDTAAASEAASTQKETERKKGPATTKTATTSENRWQKRERELKELREKVAKLESGKQPTRETEQVSQPAAAADAKSKGTPRPKLDDVDPKTGKAKFATYAEFDEAKDAWNRAEAIREFQETSTKSERERSIAQAEQTIEQEVNKRAAKARETHADYDDVIDEAMAQKNDHGQDALFYTKGSHLDGFFLDSDRGHDVMYAIAKDFDAHKAIFARDAKGNYLMNPVRQIKELTKIEASLEPAGKAAAAPKSSVTPITKAFRPPNQVTGKGVVSKDTVEQAVDDGDFETYRHSENAKDLARLQRK